MTPSSSSLGESSLLLWALAAAVAWLAAHVFLGWLREAQRQPSIRESWLALLLAAFTLGTGICAALVLSVAAAPQRFTPGYRLLAAPALWASAIVAVLLPAYWLMHRQNLLAIIACGILLGGIALAVQAGWLSAVGFRPGLRWRIDFSAGAAVLLMTGATIALAVAFRPDEATRKLPLWRVGSGVVLGLSLVGGQEVLTIGASLQSQVGSVFKDQLPSAVLSLVGGVLAPLVMSVMALDLELRRSVDKRGGHRDGAVTPTKRRRRKQRIRTL